MDKFLITRRSTNQITGPIMVTTSPRFTCPRACPFRKGADTPTAGLCYAEHGALGGFVWTLLDHTGAGGSIMNNVRVHGFDELLFEIRSLAPGSLWRHNVAGDLPSNNQTTIDRAALRAITAANKGRCGFTFTHYDVLTNLANRQAIEEANENGFRINLSANTLEHADQLAHLRIAPVTVILPAGTTQNTKTPKGRTVVICPSNAIEGVTCATCGLCSRMRSTIVGFPATGGQKHIVRKGKDDMIPEIEALPFDELRTLHREIGALIAEKRSEALEQLKTQMSALGFSAEEITGRKQRRKRRKQNDEDEQSSIG